MKPIQIIKIDQFDIFVYGSYASIHFWFGLYLSPNIMILHFSLTYFTRARIHTLLARNQRFFPFSLLCVRTLVLMLGRLKIFVSQRDWTQNLIFFPISKSFSIWQFLIEFSPRFLIKSSQIKKNNSHYLNSHNSHSVFHIWSLCIISSTDHFVDWALLLHRQIKMPTNILSLTSRWIQFGWNMCEKQRRNDSRINCSVWLDQCSCYNGKSNRNLFGEERDSSQQEKEWEKNHQTTEFDCWRMEK